MFQKTKSIFLAGLPVIVIATFFVTASIYAWTEPTQAPPDGNVSSPINVSSASQYKAGALGIGGLLRGYSNAIFAGNVGIGTTNPGAKLEVAGQIKIAGGTPGLGKVLTSDAAGLASWQTSGGIIGAQDGYAGQTGTQACNAIGKSCSRVISYNFIKASANCPGAEHCMRVCMTWYNQGLPGVEDGQDGVGDGPRDNIHSCNARLGEYTTYLHSGVVRCNAYFSAVCN